MVLPISAALYIPAFIVTLRLQFYSFIILDIEAGPIEALKRSYEITKGSVLNLILFFLLISLINILGCLALLLGLFVTIPVSLVAYAHVYRSLSDQPKTKVKISRVIEKPFNPNKDIYSMTKEDFYRKLSE